MNNDRIYNVLQSLLNITAKEINTIKLLADREQLWSINAISKVKTDLSINYVLYELAKFYGIPLFDIEAFNLEYMPQNLLNNDYLCTNNILPLVVRDKRLKLAVGDPTNKELFDTIAFKTGLSVDLFLVDADKLAKVLSQISTNHFQNINLNDDELVGVEFSGFEDGLANTVNSNDDDQPIVKFIHKIILDAVKLKASDIHFEPYEKFYRVRYRVDGVLNEVAKPLANLKDRIASRLKIVAKLDIAEKRVPQDGRLRMILAENHIIDFRVSSLPTAFGEKIALRVLDKSAANLHIDDLGLDDSQKRILVDSIRRPYGMVLVTGQTGSGKTVTLYSCLNLLNDNSRNISTIEDPIEISIAGINQVAINERAGLSFATALRAFLRQDPDVIMVGEIRDFETAQIAVQAAQTGHMVLSTLHTNDTASALRRLVNMGVPSYNVGDAVLTIVAQRLVRKLCDYCKKPANYTKKFLLDAKFTLEQISNDWQPHIADGCYLCNNTGYRGRVGVFEVMPISDELRQLILDGASAIELAACAKHNGVLSLYQSGLVKVYQGVTSLAEVEANINYG